MLTLTRKPGEKVLIEIGGLSLVIELKHFRGKTIAIGFDGPRDFRITRFELQDEPKPAKYDHSQYTAGKMAAMQGVARCHVDNAEWQRGWNSVPSDIRGSIPMQVKK